VSDGAVHLSLSLLVVFYTKEEKKEEKKKHANGFEGEEKKRGRGRRLIARIARIKEKKRGAFRNGVPERRG